MGSHTCPRCSGSGTERKTEISWSTGKTEDKTSICGKCNGTGIVDNYGNSKNY